MDWNLSFFVILVFTIFIFYRSQTRFRNKMLCTFTRPNKMKIEAWVPVHSRFVVWDNGKYGVSQYFVIPKRITHMWYARGINRFFPTIVPTLDFRWSTPMPRDPETDEYTWLTPEALRAAWEEHQHVSFSRGIGSQIGQKSRFPAWFLPLITIVLILALMFVVMQNFQGIDERLFNIENR